MPTARRIAWLFFAVSLAIRAGVAVEVGATPLLRHGDWAETDNHFFAEAAQRTASDWLGETPHHPYHGWHALLWRQHARATGVAPDEAAGRVLWDRWYGGARYHQEPLYTWLLALIHGLFGDVRWVFVLQVLAGAASTVAVFLIALRLVPSVPWASVAATLHLAYGPFAYYDLVLHRTSLQTAAGLLCAWLTLRAFDPGASRGRWAALGGSFGAAVLLNSTALPLALVTLGAGLFRARRAAAYAALTFAACLAPAVSRNLAVGVAPLELSSVAAVTFINANAADVDPTAGFTLSRHAARILHESEGRLGPAAIATLETHEGLGWLGLVARKALVFFDPVEVPNNESYAYYAAWSPLLSASLGFSVYAALMVLGLLMTRWRDAWPLALALLFGLAVAVLFYNLSRFRAPLVALAIPLGVAGLRRATAELRERRGVPLTLGALALAGLTLVPWSSPRPDAVRGVDVVIGAALWHEAARDASDPGGVLRDAALEGLDVAALLGATRWTAAEAREAVEATLGLYQHAARVTGESAPFQARGEALIAAMRRAFPLPP